jgi:excisionase family DNA binding protein
VFARAALVSGGGERPPQNGTIVNQHLYTVPEVMDSLRLGRARVYDLIRSGQLSSVRIGSSRRIPATALDEFWRHFWRHPVSSP